MEIGWRWSRDVSVAWEILTRRGRGPLMWFDGRKFSNNGRPKLFSFARATARARELLRRYPILREKDYHVWVRKYERRKNPESRDAALDQAAKKFEDFTGHEADKITKVSMPAVREGLIIGELDLIGYRVKREGVDGGRMVSYGHRFSKKSRPLLAVSKDGTQLVIVGGRYEFTEAGIENR